MADTYIQRHNRLQERQRRKKSGQSGAPFFGVIEGASAGGERARVTYHGNSRSIRLNYPYASRFSWIRAMPEPGTQVILSERFDSREPEILSYYQRFPEQRAEAYERGDDLFRPLEPGEVDLASRGLGQVYLAKQPVNESRAGLIRSWLDQDKLESGAKSPLHKRLLHRHRRGAIGDEERFGVVQRYRDESTFRVQYIESERSSAQSRANVQAGFTGGPWAREYLRILGSGADFPNRLVEIREGDVIDDFGGRIQGSETGIPLRSLRKYYNEDGEAAKFELDDQGNFVCLLPSTAERGAVIRIPNGGVQLQTHRDIAIQGDANFSMTTEKSMSFTPQRRFNIGGARDENAVLGAQLSTFISSLMDILRNAIYVGNLGSAVPMSPVTQAQLTQLEQQYVTSKRILSDFIFLSKGP